MKIRRGIRRDPDEMNDHPPSTLLAKCWADRIRLIAIETMNGAFGNEGALRFYQATDGRRLDFLRNNGRTLSTSASAAMPGLFRRIVAAPCSINGSCQPMRP